jgi:spore germination protein GerM
MNKPIFFGIILFAVVFAIALFLLKRKPVENIPEENKQPAKSVTESKSTEPVIKRRINVKLFFTTPGSKYLFSEDRSILYQDTLLAQSREVLNELVKGPGEKLVSTIPQGTKLLDVFISKEGIAYADFSEELISRHPGGTDGEISTVYSIVNTLTLNFPQIKRVQILVNSQVVDTLKGHLDLSRPLAQDQAFIATKEPSTTQQPEKDSGVVEKSESWNNGGSWEQTIAKM